MANIEIIKGADNGNSPDTLREMYPKVNRNFNRLNTEISNNSTDINKKLTAHVASTEAHDAQNIIYSGTATGNNVEQAVDGLKTRVDNLIIEGGDSSPEVVDARGGYPVLGDRLNALPTIHYSTEDPTNNEGSDGDLWFKYEDLPPISIDTVSITNVSETGVTITGIKTDVPAYWDPDDRNAVITFEVRLDDVLQGDYTWAQLSEGVTITGQSFIPGSSHFVTVATKSVSGDNTSFSNQVSSPSFGPVSIPTDLSATGGNTQVTLSWAAVPGAVEYSVKRSTINGGPYTFVATVEGNPEFVDTGLTNDTIYYYVVSALSYGFESGDSNQASATPKLVQAQWLQFEFLDNNSGSGAYMDVWELEVNNPDILPTTAANWSASSTFGAGMEADKLGDNITDADHRWVSGSGQITNQYVLVNLGSLQMISNWRAYTSSNASTSIKTVRVYGSVKPAPSSKSVGVDNADWTLISAITIVPVSGGGWTPYFGV